MPLELVAVDEPDDDDDELVVVIVVDESMTVAMNSLAVINCRGYLSAEKL